MKTTILSLILCLAASLASAYTDLEKVRQLKSCPNCVLRSVSFANIDLTGVDLSGADLQFSNFRNATLYKAKLEGAYLRGANFSGARWTDGITTCAQGSIGGCNKEEPK